MPGTQSDAYRPRGALLTDSDVVRIHAATFLTLCAAIMRGGASAEQLADLLLAQVEDVDQGAWVDVVRGLASVLQRDAQAAPGEPAPAARPSLRVIEGGGGRDAAAAPASAS